LNKKVRAKWRIWRGSCTARGVPYVAACKRKPQRRKSVMNNYNNNTTALTRRRRRINIHEFAEKLCCHPDTLKRRIKKPPPQFPLPALLLGKYTWWEDEVDAYVEFLIEESRAQRA
jgi:hypothetical protein